MSPAFDNQAPTYDQWYATSLGELVDKVEQEALFTLLPEVKGLRLLEVGCGTGKISLPLASKGARLVGLDASGPMLARAQEKAQQKGLSGTWIKGLACPLPFGPEVFDGVLCILALDFMSDRETAFKEMVRVLRPGGFLAIAMLNRYSLWTLKRVVKAWFRPSLWRQVSFITPFKLGRLLAGRPELTDIRSRQAVYFPPWKNRRLVRYYPYLEKLGNRWHLSTGAFLVITARKRIIAP